MQVTSKFARAKGIDARHPPLGVALDATPTTVRELMAACSLVATDYGYAEGDAMPYPSYLTTTLLASKRQILWDVVLGCRSSSFLKQVM